MSGNTISIFVVLLFFLVVSLSGCPQPLEPAPECHAVSDCSSDPCTIPQCTNGKCSVIDKCPYPQFERCDNGICIPKTACGDNTCQTDENYETCPEDCNPAKERITDLENYYQKNLFKTYGSSTPGVLDVLVIFDTTSYSMNEDRLHRSLVYAEKNLYDLTGVQTHYLDILTVQLTPYSQLNACGEKCITAESTIADYLKTQGKNKYPEAIILFYKDKQSFEAGGHALPFSTNFVPPDYINEFKPYNSPKNLFGGIIDFDELFGLCGSEVNTDSLTKKHVSENSIEGECKNSPGMPCILQNEDYYVCENYLQSSDPIERLKLNRNYFISQTVIHEYMHNFGGDTGENDHSETNACKNYMQKHPEYLLPNFLTFKDKYGFYDNMAICEYTFYNFAKRRPETASATKCTLPNGESGLTGSGALPKVRFYWGWGDKENELPENACETSNPNGIYCDPVQFTITLMKKLHKMDKAGKIEETSFMANLIGDNYNQDFFHDFANEQGFLSAPSWFDSSATSLNKYLLQDRIKFESETITSGKYKVQIQITSENPVKPLFNNTGEPNATITVTFAKTANAEKNNFYYIPINGKIGLQDGRNNYGVKFENTQEPIYINEGYQTQSQSGAKTVETNVYNDFETLNIGITRGLALETTNDSITMYKSSPVPVLAVFDSEKAIKGLSYKLFQNNNLFEITGLAGTWQAFSSSNECKDASGNPLPYYKDDEEQEECFSIENPSETKAKVFYSTVFFVPQETIMSLKPCTEGSVFETRNAKTESTNTTIALETNLNEQFNSIQKIFDLVSGKKICVVEKNSGIKYYWNEKKLSETMRAKAKEHEANECTTNYETLLNNERITKAIELNPVVRSMDYKPLLLQKINELESGNTLAWSNYRQSGQWPRENQLRELYLQKVALSLYVEIYRLVPWSILDYSDSDLQLLLSDLFVDPQFYVGYEPPFFNGNPLKPFEYAKELQAKYQIKKVSTQKDLIDLLIYRMRDELWRHRSGVQNPNRDCGYIIYDFECLEQLKQGSDPLTSSFIYSVLQTHNIPSKQIPHYLGGGGHAGINFPTESLSMQGNDVYSSLKAGFIIQRNSLPIDLAYVDLKTYGEWSKLEYCKASSAKNRKDSLDYLNLYNNTNWNKDIIATYCYTNPQYAWAGDYLKEMLQPENAMPNYCQNTDPAQENYFPAPLTQDEINQWLQKIRELAGDC